MRFNNKKISHQLNCLPLSDFLNHMLYNPFPTSCPNDSCDNVLHVSKQLEVQPKFHNLERKFAKFAIVHVLATNFGRSSKHIVVENFDSLVVIKLGGCCTISLYTST
jgi:hypothetical protein